MDAASSLVTYDVWLQIFAVKCLPRMIMLLAESPLGSFSFVFIAPCYNREIGYNGCIE